MERELPKEIMIDGAKSFASWWIRQRILSPEDDSRNLCLKRQCYGIVKPRNRILNDSAIQYEEVLQIWLQSQRKLKVTMRTGIENAPWGSAPCMQDYQSLQWR